MQTHTRKALRELGLASGDRGSPQPHGVGISLERPFPPGSFHRNSGLERAEAKAHRPPWALALVRTQPSQHGDHPGEARPGKDESTTSCLDPGFSARQLGGPGGRGASLCLRPLLSEAQPQPGAEPNGCAARGTLLGSHSPLTTAVCRHLCSPLF